MVSIPHFGQSMEVNIVVKLLFSRVHGGYLWMDSRISINPHLIWRITRLSKQGIDPTSEFVEKDKDKQLAKDIKAKYELKNLGRWYGVSSIHNKGVYFAMQLLVAKLFRKCQHNQVSTLVISLAAKCVKGTIYNWVTFLLNEFIEHCNEAWD